MSNFLQSFTEAGERAWAFAVSYSLSFSQHGNDMAVERYAFM